MISIRELINSEQVVKEARFVVAQSILCHRDWDVDDHVSFLKFDEGIDTDVTVIVDGVHMTLEQLVNLWVHAPAQCVGEAQLDLVS